MCASGREFTGMPNLWVPFSDLMARKGIIMQGCPRFNFEHYKLNPRMMQGNFKTTNTHIPNQVAVQNEHRCCN